MKPLELSLKAPGKTISIGGIPTAITHDHNEVFYYWLESGIKKATLFHIDAHSDTAGARLPLAFIENLRPEHWQILTIAGFICPAFHAGVVSDIYWFNPYLDNAKLREIGSGTQRKRSYWLKTTISERLFYDGLKHLVWDEKIFENLSQNKEKGREIDISQVKLNKQLIVDIDLDAFYCEGPLWKKYDPGKEPHLNYKQRLIKTVDVLKSLGKRPDLITITRSAGEKEFNHLIQEIRLDLMGGKTRAYVPKEVIPIIEKDLTDRLTELYA